MYEDIKDLYHISGTKTTHAYKNFNVITSSCYSAIYSGSGHKKTSAMAGFKYWIRAKYFLNSFGFNSFDFGNHRFEQVFDP